MRLLGLRVADFAAIVTADIELGRGLNVLYGANDLGKSTLADSIRLGLLLPHASTYAEEFVPWTGGQHPQVEVTFETEAQRIWRVKKVFGKSGSSTLFASRNGEDFDETARGRQVDAKLREILQWGIPEPGGAGGGRGLPASFLATVLLSTQADVTGILRESLAADPTQSGKERIAAALQAVAQDPVFLSLLRRTQQRRDVAYTERGAPKQGKDSPFKRAAERLRELRTERDELQKQVDESHGVELHLNELVQRRMRLEGQMSVAVEDRRTVERFATEAAGLAAALERVTFAQENVVRIRKLDAEVMAAGQALALLARKKAEGEEALAAARRRRDDADRAFESALADVRAAGSDPSVGDTVARQALELRRVAAASSALDAEQRMNAASAAQEAVDAVARAQRGETECVAAVEQAAAAESAAADRESVAAAELRGVEVLESALAIRATEDRLAAIDLLVNREATLQLRRAAVADARRVLEERRTSIVVPIAQVIAAIRRLSVDLTAARAALEVGILVTVTPRRPISLRSTSDGITADAGLTTDPVDMEARAAIDIDIADVATIAVRGGRRDAQHRVLALEQRWALEAVPHLAAATAADVDELDERFHEAARLDADIAARDTELQSIEEQVGSLQDPGRARAQAAAEVNRARAALGDIPLDVHMSEFVALGDAAADLLRVRKESAATALAKIRASLDRSERRVAEERLRNAGVKVAELAAARDRLLPAFPNGPAAAIAAAREASQAAAEEEKQVAVELSALEQSAAAETARIEAAVSGSRAAAEQAKGIVESAERDYQQSIEDHGSQSGGLEQLRRLRQAEDLSAAEETLRLASEHHASLPVPARPVTPSEVTTAHQTVEGLSRELTSIGGEIQKAHGALEQVGGGVARERLRDVLDAYEQAERHEREVEIEFEAWKLLLEQMKAADAAQASNLGQVLGPAIATRFEALTEKRYEGVRLTAQLGTEGIVIRGTVRPTERMSVGTREQLSTLYRLSLAEYLRTTVVLDDQLVQSDTGRMDWFRELLADKAHTFQIVVLTCRPDDYLLTSELVPADGRVFADHGSVRAIDLGRAIQRR